MSAEEKKGPIQKKKNPKKEREKITKRTKDTSACDKNITA